MIQLVILIGGALLVATVFWLMTRSGRREHSGRGHGRSRHHDHATPAQPLHNEPAARSAMAEAELAECHTGSVIVPEPGNPCAAVQAIRGRWFPDGKVPRLPLPDCDHSQTCECRFKHRDDRRTDERREHADRRDSIRFEERTDRRDGGDRRKSVATWRSDL